jgi:hypothetical protein
MKRVTGIGGIFFKAKDAAALQAWYKRHLGIDVQEWGGTAFTWTDAEGKPVGGTTVWSIGRLLRAEHSKLHGQLPSRGRPRSGEGSQAGRLQRSRQDRRV